MHKQRVVANNGGKVTAWLPAFADASPARYGSLANLPVVGCEVIASLSSPF